MQRLYITDKFSRVSGPSTAARKNEFQLLNGGNEPVILNARPPNATGLPITLMHPVFSEFLRQYHAPAPPQVLPDGYLRDLAQLRLDIAGFYGSEIDRVKKILPSLQTLIGSTLISVTTENSAKLDGVALVREFAKIILEYKNEIGEGGTDGSIQVAIGYGKWVVQSRVR